MQRTADLVQPAQEAVVEIRKVFQSIGKLTPIVEETLKDFREIGKMAKQVGPDLQKASEEIQVTARVWGKVGERTDVLLKTNEDKIVKSIDRMEEALKRVNTLFSDENQKLVQDTLKNVRNGSQQLEVISKDTTELIKESRMTLKQFSETMKHADEAISDLQKAMKPLSEKGPGMFKNFNESSENLNKTLKDLRELIQVIARGDGTVQRLLSDPALYNNLNDSAIMVTKILPRLDRVLRDMEIFADKLARHPELIGLRGAIVPSIGLKESPSVIPYRVIP
jgi:phospholipid/cholesterol/gamma-HCH transport system substrate-binding protein